MSKLRFSEAKSISIVDYLSRLGHEPTKTSRYELWYRSPLRIEKEASFKVDARKNIWYDHGESEKNGKKPGGNIIDLVMQLHNCTPREAVEKLSSGSYTLPSLHQPKVAAEKPEPLKIEIQSVERLTSPTLIEYLNGRGIDANRAQLYCKEIEFWMNRRLQLAIGFPTRSGSYELRNHWFKGSTSPKDISYIDNKSHNVSVFEGFIDFMSATKVDHPQIRKLTDGSDFIILNSVGLMERCLPILQQKDKVVLFLDNDAAGNKAKLVLNEKGIDFKDASSLYAGHKDVNDLLRAQLKEREEQLLSQRKSRGMRL